MTTGVDSSKAAAHWRRLCPTVGIVSIRRLGAGSEHEAHVVNDRFVVRFCVDGGAGEFDRERAVLELAARRSTVGVPEVVAWDDRAIVTRMVVGRILLDERPGRDEALAEDLVAFLDRLHSTPADEFRSVISPDPYPIVEALDEAAETFEGIESILEPDQRRAVETFLTGPIPPDGRREAFCHNDLGAEHLVVTGPPRRLAGVIDWSDAAATDPAHDLARLFRDLPSELFARVEASYTMLDDDLASRIRFFARCYLLEDLSFALESGLVRYRENASREFRKVFDQS